MLSPGLRWERGWVSTKEWWLKGVNMFGLSRTKQLNQYWKYITGPGFYRQSVRAAPVTIRYLGWTVIEGLTKHLLCCSNQIKINITLWNSLGWMYFISSRGREDTIIQSHTEKCIHLLKRAENWKIENIFYLFSEYLFLVSSSKVDWIIAVKIIDRRMVRHAGIASLIGTLKSNLHINRGIQRFIKLHTRSPNNKLTTTHYCFLDYF